MKQQGDHVGEYFIPCVITCTCRMLDTFVQQHSAPPPGKEPVAVTYLVTGVSHDPERDDDKVCINS